MNSNRNEIEQLLKSRSGVAAVGLPVLVVSIWCLVTIRDFLGDRKEFDWFDWFVFLFFNEFFFATLMLGTLLVACACVDPPWLRKLLIDAGRHVRWLSLLFFVSMIAIGALGGLVIVPCLIGFGFLE